MHVIRLRGPWELTCDDQLPTTIKLPHENWLDRTSDSVRSIRLARRFQKPTGIESQQVFVAIQFRPVPATVSLNGHPLGPLDTDDEVTRFHINDWLGDQNQLTIDVHRSPAGRWTTGESAARCEVQLEIE